MAQESTTLAQRAELEHETPKLCTSSHTARATHFKPELLSPPSSRATQLRNCFLAGSLTGSAGLDLGPLDPPGTLWNSLGPHGKSPSWPGPRGRTGPSWLPMGPNGLGPDGPPYVLMGWALVGLALMGPPGPCSGPGPNDHNIGSH